uniref:Uncharacterized protein n=1 Tax=Meloidogyne floridensis TaxID=298350 RepID=A0A915NNY1_9BILA
MATKSSSDVGQFEVIHCFDVGEVKIYLNLFIGDETKPRWHEEPHDDDNKNCSFSDCPMEMVGCFDDICIKLTACGHNHEGDVFDEALTTALHLF